MTVPLSRFFDEVLPFVLGRRNTAELESRIGPSASGADHLRIYESVVCHNIDVALRAVYEAVKHAADRLSDTLWPQLMAEYFAAYPPRHFDPNRVGEEFPSFLERRRRTNAAQPPFLEELADYEWVRFVAATAVEQGLERTVFVRRYSHAVPEYAKALARGQARDLGHPAATATTIVVFRSATTFEIKTLSPSREQLLALGRATGDADTALLASSGVAPAVLDAADRRLRELGLDLPAPSPAPRRGTGN